MLTQCSQMAKRFLEERVLSDMLKCDELVPEPVLYAFELAHNASARDHSQARPLFLYFAPDELADTEIVYVMADRKGQTRVEVYTGMMYEGDPARRGFVLCARHHAVELLMPAMTPTEFNAFCVQVLRLTGVPVARYHMLGWKAMFESLQRFPGQTPHVRPSDLRVCEQCPSETAPKVRLAPRGRVGAASDDLLTAVTAETAVAALASTGTVALGAASDAREGAVAGALGVLFGVGSANDLLAGVRPPESIVRATRVCDVPMGAGRAVAMYKCDCGADEHDGEEARLTNILRSIRDPVRSDDAVDSVAPSDARGYGTRDFRSVLDAGAPPPTVEEGDGRGADEGTDERGGRDSDAAQATNILRSIRDPVCSGDAVGSVAPSSTGRYGTRDFRSVLDAGAPSPTVEDGDGRGADEGTDERGERDDGTMRATNCLLYTSPSPRDS